MGDQRNGGISWCDATWNPIRGCSRVSEACRFCYAERQAARFSGPGQPYDGLARMTPGGPRWTGEVRLVEEHLLDPLRWKRPRRIFVNSMSDLFHEKLSDHDIERVFGVMALAPQHTFQVLTKRSDRMRHWFNDPMPVETRELQVLRAAEHAGQKLWGVDGAPFVFDSRGSDPVNYPPAKRHPKVLANRRKWPGWPLPNVHLGVSVENQEAADERIPDLLQCPAAVRWISAEPLLGPINAWAFLKSDLRDESLRALGSPEPVEPGLDWVVVGGESGPGARPMHPGWARSLRDQCDTAGVPFFFKQWGDWAPRGIIGGGRQRGDEPGPEIFVDRAGRTEEVTEDDATIAGQLMRRVGKHAAGDELDGVRHQAFPGGQR